MSLYSYCQLLNFLMCRFVQHFSTNLYEFTLHFQFTSSLLRVLFNKIREISTIKDLTIVYVESGNMYHTNSDCRICHCMLYINIQKSTQIFGNNTALNILKQIIFLCSCWWQPCSFLQTVIFENTSTLGTFSNHNFYITPYQYIQVSGKLLITTFQ